jgi:hypothetical protein
MPPYADTKLGFIRGQEFTEEAKVVGVDRTDFNGIYTNELIDDINAFEIGAVQSMAQTYG